MLSALVRGETGLSSHWRAASSRLISLWMDLEQIEKDFLLVGMGSPSILILQAKNLRKSMWGNHF